MKRFSLVLILTLVLSLTIAVGAAFALPTTVTDFTGDATLDSTADTQSGFADATGSGARLGSENGQALAEHSDTTTAPADSSYGPHGKYTTDTNACGRCHQLHQAKAERLFRFNFATTYATVNNPIYGICTYCHRFNGQSTYDVVDGMIWDTTDGIRYATNGGGFERQLVVEGPATIATVVKSSSSHQVNMARTGAGAYIKFLAPGGPGYDGSTADHIELKCSSCHNPHGSVNARALAEDPMFATGNKASALGGGSFTAFSSGDKIPEFVENRFANEKSIYPTKISRFCAACHRNYLNESGSGSDLTGANFTSDNQRYRHKMNMTAGYGFNTSGGAGSNSRTNDSSFGYASTTLQLPLGTTDNVSPIGETGTVVVCTTCHFAHGTSAEMTKNVINNTGGSADRVDNNSTTPYNLLTNGGAGSTYYETIKNLRMDNRAVCQNCHNRNSVDTTAPALQKIIDPTYAATAAYGSATAHATSYAMKATAGSTTYVVIRYNQYMAKGPAETAANFNVNVGAGLTAFTGTAVLQPDGRSIVLSGGNLSNAVTQVQTTTSLVNINGQAAAAETKTVD